MSIIKFDINKKGYFSKKFNNIELSYEKVENVEFEDCTFVECRFSDTEFVNCRFVDCLFLKTNLSLVIWSRCKFNSLVFDQCKLVGVDWTTVTWPNVVLSAPMKFQQCILNDASFFGLELEELVLEACQAIGVDFREANLEQGCFRQTNFEAALFNDTNLKFVDFTDAINYRIDVLYNEVKGAKFCRQEAISLLEGLEIELVD